MATVLYVDDERAISRALSSWLTRRGHTVFTAASMADAKSSLQSHPIDGAFIDLWLGSENGLELFEWIDVNFPRVAQNTAFVTGDIIPDPAVQAALDHYARPVLVKPFELSELEGTVKAWRSP
jgi:DNA-binding NtrC family response regulator